MSIKAWFVLSRSEDWTVSVAEVQLNGLVIHKLHTAHEGESENEFEGTIHFSIVTDDATYDDLTVRISQSRGESFFRDPMAAGQPIGRRVPLVWNHSDFLSACEDYVRQFVGNDGCAVSTGGPVAGLTMINCRMALAEPKVVMIGLPPI